MSLVRSTPSGVPAREVRGVLCEEVCDLLTLAPVTVALLTGRVTGAERERVLEELRSGAIDVIVGTTALIQEQVEFSNLSFVVVDEQHRFGVEQRGVLRNKAARQPHLLVMSATPIPRSLALTIYGDLDVSVINEMPPGRIPVKTRFFRQGKLTINQASPHFVGNLNQGVHPVVLRKSHSYHIQ